jgi:hypothetical protein
MSNYLMAIRCFLSLWGTANWYQGVDYPTLWQRLYKWRVSPALAWELTSIIWLDKQPKTMNNDRQRNFKRSN